MCGCKNASVPGGRAASLLRPTTSCSDCEGCVFFTWRHMDRNSIVQEPCYDKVDAKEVAIGHTSRSLGLRIWRRLRITRRTPRNIRP
jgi:hypothetical protein